MQYAAKEAEVVAQAGRKHAITLSTNMAGRGTDIILGGNPKVGFRISFLFVARLWQQYDLAYFVYDCLNGLEKKIISITFLSRWFLLA